ncbi:hypothetical protein M0R45_013704 [Rubus argutus]|uniref:BTB domain-containing protein n=1 Tax=Rubus argutus TaxID=59490 RepID=A0AAW1XJL4_RUBAR
MAMVVEQTDENLEDNDSSSSWVRLNVGGKIFCTTIDTLTVREPDSMLAAMFSGRYPLKQEKGYVLIDRDGDYFGYILNWLRDGDVPTLEAPKYSQLLKEAQYFQLLGLIDGINLRNISDLTRTDVIKCLHSSERTFQGVNLSGLNLSQLDLSNIDFSYSCLRNVSFSNANLEGAKFHQITDAEGANFSGSILKNSVFADANLCGASFVDANLKRACFRDATLSGGDFRRSNLKSVEFSNILEAEGSIFDRVNLESCTFRGIKNFGGASFARAHLNSADLGGACLRNCIFRETDLRSANLYRADLTNAILKEANLENARL